jgi:hypothetical protein
VCSVRRESLVSRVTLTSQVLYVVFDLYVMGFQYHSLFFIRQSPPFRFTARYNFNIKLFRRECAGVRSTHTTVKTWPCVAVTSLYVYEPYRLQDVNYEQVSEEPS